MRNYVPVDIAIMAEGTYPYIKGGVSSVIHQVVEAHPQLTFGIIHIAWDRSATTSIKYTLPPQIQWIFPIYLTEHGGSEKGGLKHLLFNWKSRNEITKAVNEVFASIAELRNRNEDKFIQVYNDYFNPRTRHLDFRDFLRHQDYFDCILTYCRNSEFSFEQLFWLQHDLFSISFSILEKTFPKAKVYHSHTSGYAGFAGAIAANQNQSQFILTEHSLYLRDVNHCFENQFSNTQNRGLKNEVWKTWFQLMGQFTYSQCRYATYLFTEIADDATRLGSDPKKIKIIPNGVSFERFTPAREAQNQLRMCRSKNGQHHQWQFTFLGRIVPIKGVLDLIEAIHLLKTHTTTDFRVRVMGPTDEDPEYFELCRNRVQELGLDHIMQFCGVQDVVAALATTDILLLTSHSEALPLVVLEAMAAGVPVLGTDVGAMKPMLTEPLTSVNQTEGLGPAGVLVPPKQPKALMLGISALTSNPQSLLPLSVNGPERVKHSFDAGKVMNQYAKLYAELLKSSRLSNRVLTEPMTPNKGCAS